MSAEVRVGMLRRQLNAELVEVDNQIRQSGLNDEMTHQIAAWRDRFVRALRSSADENEVCQIYITLMQRLLCDPVTNAPLDAFAVLGNDGHTYGQMSLAVHRLTVAEQFRNRSPLDPNNPAPFLVAPHTLARHMIRWLQRHHALLYSRELEQRYLQLLPHHDPADHQARIERIRARQQALDQVEAARRREQFREIDRGIDARLHAWENELAGRVQALRVDDAPLQQNPDLAQVQARLDRLAAQDNQNAARLNARLNGMQERVNGVQEQVQAAAQEEAATIERLRAQIQDRVQTGVEQVAQRIQNFAQDAQRDIHQAEQNQQEALQQLQGRIQQVRQQIAEENRRQQDLVHGQQNVTHQLAEVRREEAELQQAIRETEIAIEEMKENSITKLITSVAIVGACIFATWAVQATGFSFVPTQGGGAGVKYTIHY